MSRLVLDASAALAWIFRDATTPETEAFLDALAAGDEALVPAIWPAEVANALLSAERRRRVTVAQTQQFLQRLDGFALSTDAAAPSQTFERVLPLARQHRLTVYGAAYLELALRHGIPLATLDAALKKAAAAAGVTLAGRR